MRDPVMPYYTPAMPAARIDADRPCPQHHQLRSQCRPSDRHVHSMRFRDDDWENAEQAAWASRSDATTLTTLAMNAMSGYIRCYRCKEDAPPVPVVMGDLSGTTLLDALTGAEKQVVSQHPRHEPVTVGAKPSALAHAPRGRKAARPVAAASPVRFADGTGQQAAW